MSWVSDIAVLDASQEAKMLDGVRAHFISSGWFPFVAMAALPPILRNIGIELIEARSSGEAEGSYCGSLSPSYVKRELSATGEQK
jgi:hypothetical protein